MHEHSNQEKADCCTCDGEKRDRKLFFGELFKIEQERAGEQQQRQHAVQDQGLKVDVQHQVGSPLMNCRNARGGQHEYG